MIELKGITKSFGQLKVLETFSLAIEEEKVLCLLGASGCGKTTLLKILANLDTDYTGEINGLEGKRISYVFQESRLIPWLTVRENLLFVLEGQVEERQLEEQIEAILEQVNLLTFKDVYPNTLSGGMKQRVSLARAFVMPHDLLLLDEPFQGLDEKLKNQLIELLEKLIQLDKKTVVMVTHDKQEAFRLGDKILELVGKPISYGVWVKKKNTK